MMILEEMRDFRFYSFMDTLLGENEKTIAAKVRDINDFFAVSFDSRVKKDAQDYKEAPRFHNYISLFSQMKSEVSCFKNTKLVSNVIQYMIEELSNKERDDVRRFLIRDNILNMVALNTFCAYPEGLESYYKSVIELAETEAVYAAADMVKQFYKNDLTDFLIEVMSDTGGDGRGGIRRLVPLFSELREKDAWKDVLLLFDLARKEDRPAVANFLDLILKKEKDTGGESLGEIFFNSISGVSIKTLLKWFGGFTKYLINDPNLGENLLSSIRRVYFLNRAHPFLDVYTSMLSSAGSEELFTKTFSGFSGRMKTEPQFKKALRGSLVKSATLLKDGRAEELVDSLFILFENIIKKGMYSVELNTAADINWSSLRLHNLKGSEILSGDESPRGGLREEKQYSSCKKVNPGMQIFKITDAGFQSRIDNFASCANEDGEYGDLVSSVGFLKKKKTQTGKDYLRFQVDVFKDLVLEKSEARELVNRGLLAFDDGRAFRLFDAIPVFIKTRGVYNDQVKSRKALFYLFDLAAPILKEQTAFDRVQKYLAKTLRRDNFPDILLYLERLKISDERRENETIQTQYDFSEMKRIVGNSECVLDERSKMSRALDVVDDYDNSVTSFELTNGDTIKTWSFDEFYSRLEPVLGKIRSQKTTGREASVIDSLVGFLNYFALEHGHAPGELHHYEATYLYEWLNRLSKNHRLITYFYPGETLPRVRLINGLDMLELMGLNADISIATAQNLAFLFFSKITEAWGDEPRNVWPDEIEQKYPVGSGLFPKTLKEAVGEITVLQGWAESLVGFPELPKCYQDIDRTSQHELEEHALSHPKNKLIRIPFVPYDVKTRIYNIRQLLPMLNEILPGSGYENAGAIRVLRDLFYQINKSTPEQFRNSKSGYKNNFSLIFYMKDLGFLRSISKKLMYRTGDDEVMNKFFVNFIAAASVPENKKILENLFENKENDKFIEASLIKIFKALENHGPEEFTNIIYYLISEFDSKTTLKRVSEIISLLLSKHKQFITENLEEIFALLSDKKLSRMVEAFYWDLDNKDKLVFKEYVDETLMEPMIIESLLVLLESVLGDKNAQYSLNSFWGGANRFLGFWSIKKLNLNEMFLDLFHFFQEPRFIGGERTLSGGVGEFLAKILERGYIDEYLYFAQKDPEGLYLVLDSVAKQIGKEDIREYMTKMRRNIN